MSNVSSVEKIEQVLEANERKIPATIYYTVGMMVMFALYIPAFLAGFALQEVQWKVYDRILLGRVSPVLYTLSIFFTGTFVAFIQQAIMLLFGMLVLGIEWITLEGMGPIIISYSVFVGALSALITTLQFRTKTEGIANVFNGLFITVFSFLGGSFFNIRDISETLGKIGDFTPNGATMSANTLYTKRAGFISYLVFYVGYICSSSCVYTICHCFLSEKRCEQDEGDMDC